MYGDEIHGVDATTTTKVSLRQFNYNIYKRLYTQFMNYCTQLPILGFNSSRYDLNLIKSKIGDILGDDRNIYYITVQ